MWPSNLICVIVAIVGTQVGHSAQQSVHINDTLLTATNTSEITATNTTGFLNGDKHVTGNVTQIEGGRRVQIREVPYQIALFRNNFFICGGSILSVDWVVTAAHCVLAGGSFGIRSGSSNSGRGGKIRYVSTVVINGGFSFRSLDNDIALLRTDSPFTWSSRVQPIILATARTRLPAALFASGWSSVGENRTPEFLLRGAEVSSVPRDVCRLTYLNKTTISNGMICANVPGSDACQGDSGGPLAYEGVLYGIVSFGFDCGRPNFPSVYTNVRRQFRWIRTVVRRHGGQMPKLLN